MSTFHSCVSVAWVRGNVDASEKIVNVDIGRALSQASSSPYWASRQLLVSEKQGQYQPWVLTVMVHAKEKAQKKAKQLFDTPQTGLVSIEPDVLRAFWNGY